MSIFAIPSIIYLAHHKNILDEPNGRTIHVSLTPRLGGLAIFAGFMSSLTIFGDLTNPEEGIQQVLASCVIIFFIGLKDDIAPVSAFKKFFIQVLASGIVMFIGDIRIESFHGFMGIYHIEEGISYLISFIIIIGLTHAFNLIDGVDGLAGTVTSIAALVFGIYFFAFQSAYAVLCFCLLGSVLGFLRYNLYKARIFMGDTGSLLSGFIMSVLAIKFLQVQGEYDFASPALAISALIIPILDTIRVFFLRSIKGKSPFSPDKNHLHHRLMDMGLSQVTVVSLMGILNICFVLFSAYFHYLDFNVSILIFVVSSVMISGIIELLYHLNIKRAAQ
jgi:UDP-N-acetylmuramyl pentapeptide phosphotransferase/UDP-N-acetylglucosamine-1-phosphate transferase